jgi:PPOX class probable F420-dependent enzyme
VSIALSGDGDRAFFRSFDKAWKTKRLARDPRVDAAPSTLRGKPIGPAVHGTAALLSGEDERIAARSLARRHRVLQGLLVPLTHRLRGLRTMHYELHV